MVREFHRVYSCATDVDLATAPDELIDLRINLLQEELDEYAAALADASGSVLAAARELADSAYVTVGAAVAFGLALSPDLAGRPTSVVADCGAACIALVTRRPDAVTAALGRLWGTIRTYQLTLGFDPDRAFTEVHRANMSKLGADGRPVMRSDGKVLKGPHFTPPDMRVAILNGGRRG